MENGGSVCASCPRACGVRRDEGERGYCGEGSTARVAKAYLHRWEEPCLCGDGGSGTVFFSGCNLRCVYCQNAPISRGGVGVEVSDRRLADIYLSLEAAGAKNINLVTPTHFLHNVVASLTDAKGRGLSIPVVYNCGGYESVEAIRALRGLVDIYMPDFKYASPTLARDYSGAEDYFDVATAALDEMVAQQGRCVDGKDGLMVRGVIVRHLLLPGSLSDSRTVLTHLYRRYGNTIRYSIMRQYTPPKECPYPTLLRTVTEEEYDELTEYAAMLGIENGYFQEGESIGESFIPDFDGEGIL